MMTWAPPDSSAISRVASMPSMPGMRMSITTTSGRSAPASCDRFGAGAGLADDLQAGGLGDDHAQGRADEGLVVGEDDPDGHRTPAGTGSRAATRKPPSGRGAAENSPCSRPTRSRMPSSP